VGCVLGSSAHKFSKYASANFRINISSLNLNGSNSVANPIGVGASVFLNYFSNINSSISEKKVNNDTP
jgi:hypothetical protein